MSIPCSISKLACVCRRVCGVILLPNDSFMDVSRKVFRVAIEVVDVFFRIVPGEESCAECHYSAILWSVIRSTFLQTVCKLVLNIYISAQNTVRLRACNDVIADIVIRFRYMNYSLFFKSTSEVFRAAAARQIEDQTERGILLALSIFLLSSHQVAVPLRWTQEICLQFSCDEKHL